MSTTPIARVESLRIGTVDFVSPGEIKVLLDIEAPDSIALNAGDARPFPRVNSYVIVPVDDAYLVGQIGWLTVERSAFPKRRGMQDFGLVDLPYPLRKMSLNPVGTLHKGTGNGETYIFRRGTASLPTVGATVLLPTATQLRSVVESAERRRVHIGNSHLAGNAEVFIDPDRLFGRHLAVLGNTGSGKSCSVAGLIRWSLRAAQEEVVPEQRVNARFVILDPNGEYSTAFGRTDDAALGARIFQVNPAPDERPLHVPLWFWDSSEWIAFVSASEKTQRPTLVQALGHARDGRVVSSDSPHHELRRFLRTILRTIRHEKNSGSPFSSFPKPKSFAEKIEKWKIGLEQDIKELAGDTLAKVTALIDFIEQLSIPRRQAHPNWTFLRTEIDDLLSLAAAAHSAVGGKDEDAQPLSADSPLPFTSDDLVRSVEASAEMLNVTEYVETLLIRLRSLFADSLMMSVIEPSNTTTLDGWLTNYVGGDRMEDPKVTIIDLSLVPTQIVHTLTAVIARIIFEALQRYRKVNKKSLPTVLVMEEAHTFIRRYKDDVESHDAAAVCCQVFERIAREGRKFGLGLVLSSQRPSELSPTVLSQCNSFLLHRISNDRDQDLVGRLVPDNLRGLLRELPSLPSQSAVLLGWVTELPVLLRMRDLPLSQRPHSADPDFWDVWIGKDPDGNEVERKADWGPIADDWQGKRVTDVQANNGTVDPSDSEEVAESGDKD